MDFIELFNKYSIIPRCLRRFYFTNISERKQDLEGSTPVVIYINRNFYILKDTWVNSVYELSSFLQKYYPKNISELYEFRTEWSKAPVFTSDCKNNKLAKEISKDLFINVNHTAVHSFWLIYDLLVFYGVDTSESYVVLTRTPKNEPMEVRNLVEPFMRNSFFNYLLKELNYSEIDAKSISNSFIKFNKIIQNDNKTSINNAFLIDDINRFYVYKEKLLNISLGIYNSTKLQIIKRYLTLFEAFLKSLSKKENIYCDESEFENSHFDKALNLSKKYRGAFISARYAINQMKLKTNGD